MYSTGEVASFGDVFEEALLKSWLSAQPNKMPRRNALVYTFDEAYAKDVEEIRRALSWLELLEPGPEVVDLIKWRKVDVVITAGVTPERDYAIRRVAADTSTPLVLHPSLGLELARAFNWLREGGKLAVGPW